MQQYAMRIRYSAFGYLNDSDIQRDGAALRARMKFIGPERPVPGSANLSNDLAEWDASTGVFVRNPDSSDATASAVSDSGVMNYLNKFGQASHTYKTFDPVSEMYYAATRYFRNLGNVSSYTSGAQGNATFKDGFPVIDFQAGPAHDPILYSCQKNFILGIGDTNTHADSNLPGAGTPPRSGNEPSMPAEVSGDTTVNAVTATNKVGELRRHGQRPGRPEHPLVLQQQQLPDRGPGLRLPHQGHPPVTGGQADDLHLLGRRDGEPDLSRQQPVLPRDQVRRLRRPDGFRRPLCTHDAA